MNKPYIVACKDCGRELSRENRNPYSCGICRGTSYPLKFVKLRAKIIPKAKCTICGMTNKRSLKLFRKGLHLHHLDGDRTNNAASNLTVKCVQCHLGEHRKGRSLKVLFGRFGNRRIYWRDIFDRVSWQSKLRTAKALI